MSANIKASVDGTQAIIGVGGVDQMISLASKQLGPIF
jgi:hypothetical protein